MKNRFSKSILLVCLMLAFAFISQAQAMVGMSDPAKSPISIGSVVSAVLLVYEAVVRLVPTVGNNSIVHSVLNILRTISDALNVKKKI